MVTLTDPLVVKPIKYIFTFTPLRQAVTFLKQTAFNTAFHNLRLAEQDMIGASNLEDNDSWISGNQIQYTDKRPNVDNF